MLPRALVITLLVTAVSAATVSVAAAAPAAKAPNACKVVSEDLLFEVVGATTVTRDGAPLSLDEGRGSHCTYWVDGGSSTYRGDPDYSPSPTGFELSAAYTPVKAGRHYVQFLATEGPKLRVVPDGPGDQARLREDKKGATLLAFKGKESLLLFASFDPDLNTALTKRDLVDRVIAIAETVLDGKATTPIVAPSTVPTT